MTTQTDTFDPLRECGRPQELVNLVSEADIYLLFLALVRLPDYFARRRQQVRTELFDQHIEVHWQLLWQAICSCYDRHGGVSHETLHCTLPEVASNGQVPILPELWERLTRQDDQGYLYAMFQTVELENNLVQAADEILWRLLYERAAFSPMRRLFLGLGQAPTGRPANFDMFIEAASETIQEIRSLQMGDNWPEPEPLDGPDLPPFPVEVLPLPLRRWVEAEARATQTPPDLAAMVSLTVCAAGGARYVEVEPRCGWREPTGLYAAVFLPPGTRKSAVFRECLAPFRRFESDRGTSMRPLVANYERQKNVLTTLVKNLEKRAGDPRHAEERDYLMQQAETVQQQLDSLTPQFMPQLSTADCTPEKLEDLLGKQGGRILVASPEGIPFEMMMARYGDRPNFGVYLLGHAGDTLQTDRLSRQGVFVERPTLSVALTAQPEVLHGLGDLPELRGKGLIARFSFAVPHNMVGHRDTTAPPVPEEVAQEYQRIVLTICGIARVGIPADRVATHYLRFSPEADAMFRQFEAAIEPRLGPLGDLAPIADWAGKLCGAVARLASVLHLVQQAHEWRHQPEEVVQARVDAHERRPQFAPWDVLISGETMAAALRIAEYLIPHAQAAFGAMGRSGLTAAAIAEATAALECIRRLEKATVKAGDIQRANDTRFPTAEAANRALAVLAEKRWLRPVEQQYSGRGRRPGPTYQVHPCLQRSPGRRQGPSPAPAETPSSPAAP